MNLTLQDIETIERATLDAVPPEKTAALDGWLLGLDGGTVGRAHSAVPLDHAACDTTVLADIEAVYAERGLRAVLRVPQLPAFDGLRAALQSAGYAMAQPTCVLTGTVQAMGAVADGSGVMLLAQPDAAWRDVFLGQGFDPVDGASRVQILARAQHAVFACVRLQGQTVAAGMGSFSQGWASVHGMRTLAPFRGQGFASRILGALARETQRRHIDRAFLQVDAASTSAQALYRRSGFSLAWTYAYWSRPLSLAIGDGAA
jgi:ribosomal protein S18 acetylase RimI-like enzyme